MRIIHEITPASYDEDEEEIEEYDFGTINYSEEQRNIASALKNGNNVIVDAVAGSGKTTSIRNIVQEFPELNIIAVLYNRTLADESRQKLTAHNIEVKTIHGAIGTAYGRVCMDDNAISEVLSTNPSYNWKPFDIFIIDEAQDLKPNLVRVLRKLIRDSQTKQIVCMGDYMQCIYRFMDADERFLTMADIFFGNLNSKSWVRLTLSETYRCTTGMTDFINNSMLGEKRLISNKVGDKPIYLCCDAFDCGMEINSYIDDYINAGNSIEDIAILAYSTRSERSPVSIVANYLSSHGKKIYRPNDDYSDIRDDSLLKGKLIISTIHQFKGRQRKMVILFGFDSSLYMLNRDLPRDTCPNLMYVAVTRALERLIFIHHKSNDPLPFLRNIEANALVIGTIKNTGKVFPTLKSKNYTVTNLVRFLPESFTSSLKNLWSYEVLSPGDKATEINSLIPFGNTYEDVSAIYGTAVPVIKQYTLQGHWQILKSIDILSPYAKTLGLENHTNLCKTVKIETWEQLAWIVNLNNCINESYIHPINQIVDYSWFRENIEKIRECVSRLDFLTVRDRFEEKIEIQTKVNTVNVTIIGSIDCIRENGEPWEFKMVFEIKEEHLFQVLIYICLLYKTSGMYRPIMLFNTRTGELRRVEIHNPTENCPLILQKLLEHKIRSGDERKPISSLI